MACGHSGSTLLELILGSHSKAFGLGELVNLQWAMDSPHEGFPKLCHVCEGRCPFWNDRVDVRVLRRHFSRTGFLAPIMRLMGRHGGTIYRHLFSRSGAEVLIDGSKGVRWIARQLRRHRSWMDWSPVLIYLTRDGRAVVNSRLRKYPERGVEVESREWKETAERMNAFYAKFPAERRLTVAYEHLASDPAESIREICQFLQLDFEPQMLRFWEQSHDVWQRRDALADREEPNHGSRAADSTCRYRGNRASSRPTWSSLRRRRAGNQA